MCEVRAGGMALVGDVVFIYYASKQAASSARKHAPHEERGKRGEEFEQVGLRHHGAERGRSSATYTEQEVSDTHVLTAGKAMAQSPGSRRRPCHAYHPTRERVRCGEVLIVQVRSRERWKVEGGRTSQCLRRVRAYGGGRKKNGRIHK